ncbi:hypothetical protein DVA81_19260, partial [Acinetobacter baumannii]
VAEFLYILLTYTVISRNAPALLVACNKQGSTSQIDQIIYTLPLFSICLYVIWCLYLLVSLFYRYNHGKIS